MTYNKLASAEDVDRAVTQVASSILREHTESPLFVSLLRGANPFTSLLMFELTRQNQDFHPDLDYMMVSTYGDGQEVGQPKIITDLAPSTKVDGRSVVIVDDVLDKGVTAEFVADHLRGLGAAGVQLAVLCDKQAARQTDITADYAGFTFKDNWLVGMGMDDAQTAPEGYRWLREIWEVER